MSIMLLVLKSRATKREIEAIEKKLHSKKSTSGFNAKKYNRVLRLKETPLAIQKKMRDEWERNFG